MSEIEAVNLRRSFGDKIAVADLTLHVNGGEIYGLIGPDGAGKTSTLRMLAGLMEPSGGSVRIMGHDPFRQGHQVRERLGYMPQQYSLYGDLTVDENLAFFSEMFCLDREEFQKRSLRLLSLTRLESFGSRRADALSGGMYKKLALACSLLHNPKALLLDEPTNGVDPISRRELWDILHDFLSEGMAIMLTTPYMDEAARCHRTGLLLDGRLLEEGNPIEMLRSFPHSVFRVIGDRKRTYDLIERNKDVLASTPAGDLLRIVVRHGKEPGVLSALAGIDARVLPATPSFEDFFLTRIQERDKGEGEKRS